MVAFAVTTRAVVWIEISSSNMSITYGSVTTRAVVWIEMLGYNNATYGDVSHHPCGGVD